MWEKNRIALCITVILLALSVGSSCAAGQHEIAVNDVPGVAANPPVAGIHALQDMPIAQGGSGNVSASPEGSGVAKDDLFGLEGGNFHPYINLEGAFTDNLFNVDTNTTSNFLTTVSPGIWFTLPRKKVIPVTITPHNTAPGGLVLQVGDYRDPDKFQLFALAGSDLLFYSEDSDLNTADVDLEGLGRYNMPVGLSLQILDRYSLGHDAFGRDSATLTNQREFSSNLAMTTADWDVTEKVRFKADYSNFFLKYYESINNTLDRQDNSIDLYGIYNYSVKTSLFLEYRYTDVEYDTATETNNTQNYYYGGVRWNTTDKVALLFKAGLQQKDFDNSAPSYKNTDNLALDMQLLYHFTVKTDAILEMYRLNEESDSIYASEKQVLGLRFGYTQRATDKITGKLALSYENADYTPLAGEAGRSDDIFAIRPSVEYVFKEWLMGELAYSYETDSSSDDQYDYDANTVILSLNFAL